MMKLSSSSQTRLKQLVAMQCTFSSSFTKSLYHVCIAMKSPDGKCLRPSVSVGCLGLVLAFFGPGAKTAILTRSVVRILLVYYFL